MRIEKIEVIEKIIDKLRDNSLSSNEFIELDNQCRNELNVLPFDYNQSIFNFAKLIFEKINDDEHNEYYFQVLLEALLQKGEKEKVLSLAEVALFSKKAEDNNKYVSYLIMIDSPDSISLLTKSLNVLESFDEYGGHAQEKAIEYLMKKGIEKAYTSVEKCLFDVSDRVRATALQFVRKFNKIEATEALIKMLEDEDVRYNILIILELLMKWNVVKALPALKQYVEEDWVYENPGLLEPFQLTIKSLSVE